MANHWAGLTAWRSEAFAITSPYVANVFICSQSLATACLSQVCIDVVSAAGEILSRPLPGAGQKNDACSTLEAAA